MSRGATNLLVASCRDAIIIGHEPSLSARADGRGWAAETMTEAAIFTIGRSKTIGYGKVRPSAMVKFGLWPITEAEADC